MPTWNGFYAWKHVRIVDIFDWKRNFYFIIRRKSIPLSQSPKSPMTHWRIFEKWRHSAPHDNPTSQAFANISLLVIKWSNHFLPKRRLELSSCKRQKEIKLDKSLDRLRGSLNDIDLQARQFPSTSCAITKKDFSVSCYQIDETQSLSNFLSTTSGVKKS